MSSKKQRKQEEFTEERVKEMQQQVEEDQQIDKADHKNYIKKPFDEIVERIVRVPMKKD